MTSQSSARRGGAREPFALGDRARPVDPLVDLLVRVGVVAQACLDSVNPWLQVGDRLFHRVVVLAVISMTCHVDPGAAQRRAAGSGAIPVAGELPLVHQLTLPDAALGRGLSGADPTRVLGA